MIPNKEITFEICKQLPKAELHRHLDGSIRLTTLLELAVEEKIELPTYDLEELSTYILKDKNCNGLPHFLEAFQYTLKVMQTARMLIKSNQNQIKEYLNFFFFFLDSITRIFYEMCEDAINDGVTYLEVRFSPVLHTEKGLSLSAVMEAVCEGLALAEMKLPMKASIIVCGLRHLSPSVTKDLAEVAWRYRSKGVRGFDLAGPEDGFGSKYHKEAFQVIRSKCINVTLHSGEDSNWESVADSIHECGANRIGHGIAIQQNPQLLDYMINRGIPIECCLTSNLQIKGIKSIADHPIRRYFDKGAVVTLCCDNTTMSNITLSGEFKLAIDTFNFSVEEVIRLIDHSFASTFLDAPMKDRLRIESVKRAIEIFRDAGYDLEPLYQNAPYYLERGINVTLPVYKFTPIPTMSLDIISNLPKADLHCRLDGSVSIGLMWDEMVANDYKLLKAVQARFNLKLADINEFRSVIQCPSGHTVETIQRAKKIMNMLLQTAEQLQRGFDDVMTRALQDKVSYIEVHFRPASHTFGGLSLQDAFQVLVDRRVHWQDKGLTIAFILFVSPSRDDPVSFFEIAQMAVANRQKSVVGFGIFGTDVIPPSEMKYFRKTFDFLKSQNFNVVQFAGHSGIESMVSTINDAGASRLSGAFQVNHFPEMMNYLANYRIPVELSLSEYLKIFTSEFSFTSPVRHMTDNNVPVVICSLRSSLYTFTRNEMLFEIAKNSQFNLLHVLRLLRNAFSYNFQDFNTKKQLKKQFDDISTTYLETLGIKNPQIY
ncbi:adenosine deaminase [Cavenderia fasciculata]|uniref:adenosine deaminase n=1 Tax=Cavenderia fasciculata TaxID=261658 RepID=F4Q2A3_CACFS|nr:adenosine deaminase [Cavenderia fasciculata]EGG18123.1 adenosine deaminase [Cavenderia fasciculata]|eukprot:XP_004366164.1 adenosine deaminase [Cavenderia fasciculata]